jgi:hypothetical protein
MFKEKPFGTLLEPKGFLFLFTNLGTLLVIIFTKYGIILVNTVNIYNFVFVLCDLFNNHTTN